MFTDAFGWIMTCVAHSLIAGQVVSAGGRVEVEPSTLPAPAATAAREAAPGVEFTRAYRTFEPGRGPIDFAGRDARGRAVSVEVNGLGRVRHVVTLVTMADVPPKLREHVEAMERYDAIERVQKIEIPATGVVEYDFYHATETGRREVLVSARVIPTRK